MPATAAGDGLADPFDAERAIAGAKRTGTNDGSAPDRSPSPPFR